MVTNNTAVLDYDFYDPRNILIIDSEQVQIPAAFLAGEYVDPAADVVQKYSMSSWANEVFSPVS